jgi:outer membrane immunogenic protein
VVWLAAATVLKGVRKPSLSADNSFSVGNPIVAGALNRISQDVDMVTLRINYRFGGYAAPVTARY